MTFEKQRITIKRGLTTDHKKIVIEQEALTVCDAAVVTKASYDVSAVIID